MKEDQLPRFMFIFKGAASDMADMTEEEGRAVMAKWMAWMETVGPALTDVGTPFGPGSSVVDDGSPGDSVALTGYSIVEAADIEGAKSLTRGHPYLSEGKGNYAIQVHELLPVPFKVD